MIIDLSKLDGNTLTTKHSHNIDTDEVLSIEGRGNYTFGYINLNRKATHSPLHYATVKFAELSSLCPNQFLILDNEEKLVMDLDVENMPELWEAINVDMIESISKKYKLSGLNAKIIEDFENKIQKKLEGKLTAEELEDYIDARRSYFTEIKMVNGVYYLLNNEYDEVVDAVNELKEKKDTFSV